MFEGSKCIHSNLINPASGDKSETLLSFMCNFFRLMSPASGDKSEMLGLPKIIEV